MNLHVSLEFEGFRKAEIVLRWPQSIIYKRILEDSLGRALERGSLRLRIGMVVWLSECASSQNNSIMSHCSEVSKVRSGAPMCTDGHGALERLSYVRISDRRVARGILPVGFRVFCKGMYTASEDEGTYASRSFRKLRHPSLNVKCKASLESRKLGCDPST